MQRSDDRLAFLHGFLGSPHDWEGVIAHLSDFDCQALSYPFNIPPDSILIGYSMGGRIALRSSQPKILLSAHPGLQTPQEKARRWRQDQQWIEKLKRDPFPRFLEAWYAQPLFDTLRAHPAFPSILPQRQAQNPHILAQMLAKESLAHQTFSIPPNTVFLHGQLDFTYTQLYRTLHIPSLEIPHVGHAAHLEDPKGCARAIRKAITCFYERRCRPHSGRSQRWPVEK